LTAIGLSPLEADESVRFGVGRSTSGEDIERAASAIVAAARRIRSRRVPTGAAA
jgi:cysteine sulfinate desulfinase/cysteine desulfurase-like protein